MHLPAIIPTYSGRYAIAAALAHAGLRPGDRVLLPAYHCLAMVQPLRSAGIEPLYYPIRPDTSVDPDTIERFAPRGAKALLVVHYFGFVLDLSPLRRLADRLDLVLIEDCAHACFGESAVLPVGSVGDYAIASTRKFFPLADGGLLASARRDLSDVRLQRPPLNAEIKSALNLVEHALEYRRLGGPGRVLAGVISLKNRLLSGLKGLRSGNDTGPAAAAPQFALDPRTLAWRGTRVSAFLLRHARTENLVQRRRAYYMTYLRAVVDRSNCRPLFGTLPEGVAPQVFPLYVTSCLEVFVILKRQGVPIIRFGEFLDSPVTRDLCPVSVDYAEHLLQFPCHQELLQSEVDWIIGRLVTALDRVGEGA